MLHAGFIEPTSAEWASPVVFVPKMDGTMRFCVEYRKLNAITVRDAYPLPCMDECIDSLGDATVFTTLDCNSGYWQVEIAEEDHDKATFASHSRLYRFLRMPFGLQNAPATFQRAVDIILSGVKWKTALVYLDDVIVYSRTVTEHMAHVREILQLLHTAGMSLKLAKCAFFHTSVTYLEHVIGPGRLEVEPRNVIAIDRACAYEPNGAAILSRDVQRVPTVHSRICEDRCAAEQENRQESALRLRDINRCGVCSA